MVTILYNSLCAISKIDIVFNFSTLGLQMTSKFGNESKDPLTDYYSENTLRNLSSVYRELHFLILNCSLWRCQSPWEIPARKISDNLILVILDGKFDIMVDNTYGIAIRGDCVFIPENTIHSYGFYQGYSAGAIFILHALPYYPSIQQPFSGLDSYFQKLKYPQATISMLHTGVAMKNLGLNEAFAYSGDILRSIMFDLASDGHFTVNMQSRHSSRLKEAYQFIHDNFNHDFSICEIADVVNLKEVQFRKLFRRETGFSPNAYIQRFRLLHSARLLMRYNYSMKEISKESGFNSESYFCRAFAKYFKTTPQQYRKNASK